MYDNQSIPLANQAEFGQKCHCQLNNTRNSARNKKNSGGLPDDLNGLTKPGLALSSPQVTGNKEDGPLTMGEILGLRLNADWVVLSACNTASADGKGAEAPRRTPVHMIDEAGFRDKEGRMVFSYAHPIFWVPFTVIVDGGGTRMAGS